MHIHSYIIISHFIPLYFFLSFFLSFSLSFFFRPSEVGVGREVDRACSPGRKEVREAEVREAEAQEALL